MVSMAVAQPQSMLVRDCRLHIRFNVRRDPFHDGVFVYLPDLGPRGIFYYYTDLCR